jgi:hypothetical protein
MFAFASSHIRGQDGQTLLQTKPASLKFEDMRYLFYDLKQNCVTFVKETIWKDATFRVPIFSEAVARRSQRAGLNVGWQ